MPGKPSQDFIPIKEVRDGVIVLEDGSVRAAILTSSLNMALKSAEEQNATISQFRGFLNSLDFPIQIVVQSRRLDIRPYLTLLEERYRAQAEDLLRIQTRYYIEYIRSLTEENNIMKKNFFVIVPYDYAPLSTSNQKNFLTNLFGKKKQSPDQKSSERERFEQQRSQLQQRVALVIGGLQTFGLKAKQLDTAEIVEMYYNIFNPGETQRTVPQQQ